MKQPGEQYSEIYPVGNSLQERSRQALYREYMRRKRQRQRLTLLSAALLLIVSGTLILGGVILRPETLSFLSSLPEAFSGAYTASAEKLPFIPHNVNTSDFETMLDRELGRYSAPSLLYETNVAFPILHGVATGEAAQDRLLPLVTSQEDEALKAQLEAIIASFPPGHFTPYLYFYNPQDGSYVEINGYKPVSAASVIKLPVLMAYLKSLDENLITPDKSLLYLEYHRAGGAGELQYKDANFDIPANEVARNMIQISDNTCTNMLISALGGSDAVNGKFREFGLRRTRINRWLPDLEGGNQISTYEMATILNNIDQAATISPASRAVGLDILTGTHNKRLLPALIPKDVTIAHKTGDIGGALGDSGIFYLPDGRRYILSVQVERPYNDYTARDMIQQASLAVYQRVSGATTIATHPHVKTSQQ